MKSTKLFIIFLIASFSGYAQSIDSVEHQERRLDRKYTKIMAAGLFDLSFTDDTTAKISITAPVPWLTDIKSDIINDTLFLRLAYEKDDDWKGLIGSKARIKVVLPADANISFIELRNDAHLELKEAVKYGSLNLKATNGSVLNGKLSADELIVSLQAGSRAALSGDSDHLKVSAIGGSIFKGSYLQTMKCVTRAAGHSKVYLNVAKELIAQTTGDAVINNKGAAKKFSPSK
ncbi:GIN domain-containing protein [Mucilaginibacter lacusdianchii]|uniref:GIN domain-containing protein n=1 Tax=Mucilaginibacter lacusdianchii TaxID=2684211 RepID=UPI00131CC0DF|nr:DUF2807 domain-containing protein [Mucilaginibacter sp. JXJ CY 39]